MIRRNSKSFLAFCAVLGTGIVLAHLTKASEYFWASQLWYGNFFGTLFAACFAFFAGMIVFVILRFILKSKSYYPKFKLIYFSLLPVFMFPTQFLAIPQHLLFYRTETLITIKSASNEMETELYDLTLQEYNHFRWSLSILPNIPESSEHISLRYYHDDFLGDFSLRVTFLCSKKEVINVDDKHWYVVKMLRSSHKAVEYSNSDG